MIYPLHFQKYRGHVPPLSPPPICWYLWPSWIYCNLITKYIQITSKQFDSSTVFQVPSEPIWFSDHKLFPHWYTPWDWPTRNWTHYLNSNWECHSVQCWILLLGMKHSWITVYPHSSKAKTACQTKRCLTLAKYHWTFIHLHGGHCN